MAKSAEVAADSSGGILDATIWPWQENGDEPAAVTITVYVVTGNHGRLRVPEAFCRECNLFVRAADLAADRVDASVTVRVVSWWTHFPFALRYGGYHPPVMVVGNSRIAQGHIVPTPDDVEAAVEEYLHR